MRLPLARRLFERLVALQVHRPWWVLFVAGVLTALSLVLTFRLEVHPGFEYLLPQDGPSVRELHRVAKQTSGSRRCSIVLHADGGTPAEASAALRQAGDDLVVQLGKLGPPGSAAPRTACKEGYKFLMPRAVSTRTSRSSFA